MVAIASLCKVTGGQLQGHPQLNVNSSGAASFCLKIIILILQQTKTTTSVSTLWFVAPCTSKVNYILYCVHTIAQCRVCTGDIWGNHTLHLKSCLEERDFFTAVHSDYKEPSQCNTIGANRDKDFSFQEFLKLDCPGHVQCIVYPPSVCSIIYHQILGNAPFTFNYK